MLVREHIYSRNNNPNRSYLSPTLSIAKMFKLYKVKCTEADVAPVSEWVYRETFNTEYNLSFGRYGRNVYNIHHA